MSSETLAQSGMKWLRGVALGGLLRIHIAASPKPTPRPRVARNGGVFYPKEYQQYYAEAIHQVCRQVGSWDLNDRLQGPLCVAIDVACKRPKSTKLLAPAPDADNFAKGFLDVCTKAGVWDDDRSVVALHVTKRWAQDGEEEGIEGLVGALTPAAGPNTPQT